MTRPWPALGRHQPCADCQLAYDAARADLRDWRRRYFLACQLPDQAGRAAAWDSLQSARDWTDNRMRDLTACTRGECPRGGVYDGR